MWKKIARGDNPWGTHRRAESFVNFKAGGQKRSCEIVWSIVNDTVIEPRRFLQRFVFLLASPGQLETCYIIIMYSNSGILLTKDTSAYIAIDKNFRHGQSKILHLIAVGWPRGHEAKRCEWSLTAAGKSKKMQQILQKGLAYKGRCLHCPQSAKRTRPAPPSRAPFWGAKFADVSAAGSKVEGQTAVPSILRGGAASDA